MSPMHLPLPLRAGGGWEGGACRETFQQEPDPTPALPCKQRREQNLPAADHRHGTAVHHDKPNAPFKPSVSRPIVIPSPTILGASYLIRGTEL
jgi:hypothetical protein